MFTNTIQKNHSSFPQREAMQYKILNSLDECHLLTRRPEEYINHIWQKNELDFLSQIYQELRDDKHSIGYSKSTQQYFLRIFVIKYYASNGFFVFPSYFIHRKDANGAACILDPKYKKIQDDFDMRCEHNLIKTKWLTHFTFNCVLPDGRIIEYYFNPMNDYDTKYDSEMYFTMKNIKEKFELNKSLNDDLVVNQKQLEKRIIKI
jgi:hypothetical protein